MARCSRTEHGKDVLRNVDVDQAVLWRDGLIEFDDTPLVKAMQQMNRYSQQRLVITDRRLAALKISGIFKTGRADRIVQTAEEVLPIESRETPAGIEILHKPATDRLPGTEE